MNELSAFFDAVTKQKKIEEISAILSKNINVNSKNPKRKTALMIACEQGNTPLVHFLLSQKDIDLNLNDEAPNYFTPLLYAVTADKNGSHQQIINALFSHGTFLSDSYPIALTYYAKIGDRDKVEECITKKQCNPNYSHKIAGSALTNATEYGHEEVIAYLLSIDGINLNITNYLKETPIIIAAREGYTNLTKLFLDTGKVDLHVQSYLLGTPLTAAIYYQREDLAKELIAREEHLSESVHHRVLLCAVEHDMSEIVRLLIEKGISVNSTGEKGYKKPPAWVWDEPYPSPFAYSGPPIFELPIIVALRDNKLKVLPILLEYQANMDMIGTDKQSAKQLIEEDENITEEAKNIIKRFQEKPLKVANIYNETSLIAAQSIFHNIFHAQSSHSKNESPPQLEELKQYFNWLKDQPKNKIFSEAERLKELFDLAGLKVVIEIKSPIFTANH